MPVAAGSEATPLFSAAVAPGAERPWREELSERVENFRRRRARLREGAGLNLNLDFEPGKDGEKGAAVDGGASPLLSAEEGLEVTLERPPELDSPILDALPFEGAEPAASRGTAVEAGGLDSAAPVEIVLESLPPPTQAPARHVIGPALAAAPLGRRFVAGVADVMILMLAAALFGVVFWLVGGRLTPRPVNLLVVACVAAFFVLSYFGVFTALTSATPGLIWMGIEVQNLEGGPPTAGEAAWRAFGYLVSIAGLMLGFIWALVDSEGLTWHDRISGTQLAIASRAYRRGRKNF